jgi:hypothetical protein
MKKQKGTEEQTKIDPLTGEVTQNKHEYCTMSRKPGIGYDWFKKYIKDVFPHDYVVIKEKKTTVPRYYLELLNNPLHKEDRKRYVPGYGMAKDAKTAETATKALESADAIMDAVKEVENLHAEFGTREILDRGAVASEESTRRNMQLQLKELFNLGVLNGPDLTLLNEFTGDDFFSATTTDAAKRAKLKGVKDYVKSKISSNLKRAGLRPSVEKKTKLDNAIEVYKKKGMSESKARAQAMKLQKAGYLGN